MVKSISAWLLQKNGISLEDFFLKKEAYPALYHEAINRGETPFEQLSPIGLSLLSYLYSIKDKSEVQPVIASTAGDFTHVVSLIIDAAEGTKLTVILQLTNWSHPAFGSAPLHKTVCQLIRTNTGVQCIHIDSVAAYTEPLFLLLAQTCKTKQVKYNIYTEYQKSNIKRQKDGYQCGVFAFKDARHLIRDDDFLQKISATTSEYELPPLYLKGMQSTECSEKALAMHGDTVVTRQGKTLREVHQKHQVTGYILHFSQKYHDLVERFVEDNGGNPDVLKEAVQKYHAGTLTPQRLAQVYGPKNAAIDEASQSHEASQTDNVTRRLIDALDKYIKRIQSYQKDKDPSTIDYKHNFWFLRESRAINREINYLLAQKLKTELETKRNTSVFTQTEKYRKEIQEMFREKKHYSERGVNSGELEKIISTGKNNRQH